MALSCTGSVDIAGETLPPGGDLDFIIARLDVETGDAVSAARFGGDGDQAAFSLVARDGAPLVAGGFQGQIDFGEETVETAASSLFAVRAPLAPAGE